MVLLFSVANFPEEKFEAMPHVSSYLSGPIFVLLYHPWEEGFESGFKDHLSWLKQNGYQTISLETLIDYIEGKEVSLPSQPILLTFDDGTIENYEIVYPLLEEFGYTGVSFVITGPSFTQFSKRFWWRKVDRSGVLRIESHSHTHSLISIGPVIADFYTGEDLDYYYLIKGMDWRLGAPIYEFGYGLVNDRYFPDKRIANLCVRYVAQNGGEDFSKRENWKEELWELVEKFRDQHQKRDAYESEKERKRRLKIEIYRSKINIERTIRYGKEVNIFAYPWGTYDDELILRLKEYGCRGAVTSDGGGNFPGDNPFKIKRLVITSGMTTEDLASILGVQ
jgi:peptidoglycan/xylan/chitin deacetylase (PgdA/CDA1 family)